MAITYNIPQLFEQAFGIRGYKPTLEPGEANEISYGAVAVRKSPSVARSFFDTPVFEVINLPEGSYTTNQGENKTYGSYTFPYTLVVDVSRKKNIVKTDLQGQDGTVKEYISMSDYQLAFRGLLVNHDGVNYPEELTKRLIEMFEINKEIEITGSVLRSVYGITHIVLEELTLPRIEAMPNVQPFILQASSDNPLILNLIGNASNQ